MNYLINFWKVSLLKFQAEDIVGCQGMEPRNSPGCSDRCLRLALDTHLSPLLGPWPPVCFFFFFPGNLYSAYANPNRSPTSSQIFSSLAAAFRMKAKLLSRAFRLLLPRLAQPFTLALCHLLSPPGSGTAPARAPPILVFVPFFILFLCKSHSHPSRLGSNISSLRHNVAFCQFWSFF